MSGNSQKPGKVSRISIIMSSCLTAEGSSVTLLEPFPPLSRERNTRCPSLAGSSQTRLILILIFLALLMEGCWVSRISIIMSSCLTAEGSSVTLLEPFPPLSRERNTRCPSLAGSSQTRLILILIFLALLMEGCWVSRISIIMSSCLTAEGSSVTLLEPFPPLSRERNTRCPSLAGSSQTRLILILIFLALLMEGCWVSRISIIMSSCLTAEGSSVTLLEPFPPLSRERNTRCPSLAGSPQTRLILILIFLALLMEGCWASSSWHSLYYSYTFISKPSQGLPQFSILESVDGQPIAHYDSNTKEYRSLVPWMEKVKKEEPLWKEYTGIAKKAEQDFGRNLVTLQKYYNHSEGFHTLQWRYGCELNNDWLRGGSDQDSYDGRTFISFDKEMLSWTASDVAAQLSKRKLEGNPSIAKHIKYYLEETCIEMLRRCINYGKETLLRKEPPTVTVTSKAEASQTETHICRVDGFFPKDINATWRKDGEIWLKDTLHGLIAPNSDGTYHFWLSIRINPSERNHFQCRVEHGSLKNPLNVVLMVPAPHPLSIIIIVLGAILMAVLIGCCLCLVVHIQVQTFQASPGERSFSVRYWILIFFGLLLLILGFIGFLHYFDLILGSILLRYIFLGVFLSCCVLEIVGFSMWIKSHQLSSTSGGSNPEEIPLQQIGVLNNTAGEENQRENL